MSGQRVRAPGQAMVLLAFVLALLLAMAGLAVDGANAFAQRRNAMNGADAAAMAGARVLLDERVAGGGNESAVYLAVEQLLLAHRLDQGLALSWTAEYVSDNATVLGVVGNTSAAVPSDAAGVLVRIRYTFETYLMTVFGQRQLTVDAYSMALTGPLGSAIGEDVVPLAISAGRMPYVMGATGTFQIDLFGTLRAQVPPVIATVSTSHFFSVALDPAEDATVAGGVDCGGAPANTVNRWWCDGASAQIAIGQLLDGTTGPASIELRSEIDSRIGQTVMMPVVVRELQPDSSYRYNVRGFVALELVSWNSTTGVLNARYVPDYISPGALVGNGNGANYGCYAVNLVR